MEVVIETEELISKDSKPDECTKEIKHRLDLIDKKYDTQWKSCCITCDRRVLQFFSQLIIICMIMMFCIYQLSRLLSCTDQQTYVGILTMLIGVLIPNPKFG
jgi:hypothetical protein